MLITMEMQIYTQRLDRYRIRDQPQKAVFTFKVELCIVLKFKR